jgi:hypothetical protein
MSALPTDASERNEFPMADGLLYYFPAALAAVARVSKIGNDQHNPGEPMHWARGKSTDHANKIIRHQLDAGTLDKDGTRHSAKVAWRALAQLQEELEREEGAPLPRNARLEAIECGGCAPPVYVSPRRIYEAALSTALGQDAKLYDDLPPNLAAAVKTPLEPTRIATPAELADLRELLSAEELKGFGIGDVPAESKTTLRELSAEAQKLGFYDNPHPMQAEALRQADEFNLGSGETGV